MLPMKRRVLWVTDPWDELAPHAIDTSLRLMEISHQLGHTTFWSEPRRLEVRGSQISIEARRLVDVKPARRSEDFIFDASLVSMNPMELDTIFCRVDPPVDDRYSHHVQILNYRVTSSARAKPKIINPPGILLGLSGKMLALITGMPTPPSLITSSRRGVREFVVKHGHCVVKPLRGFQGRGVSTVSQSDVPFALDDSGDDFLPLPIIVQKCVHSRDSREIRLWFANG
jgi:glutathione synthase/RimK-type ligase-like ATP-grasp enzyme